MQMVDDQSTRRGLATTTANSKVLNYPLVIAQHTPSAAATIDNINQLIKDANLPLKLDSKVASNKLTQKACLQLCNEYDTPVLIVDNQQQLSLAVNGIQVSPDWLSLQRRIVRAGRKSELILQACKINSGSKVLDATAGFGHDSLILGSTGAATTLMEQNPLITLLLLFEQHSLIGHKNWYKLMQRLTINYGNVLCVNDKKPKYYDVVYLDPMFPENSYNHAKTGKGAKVGKHMQTLHTMIKPPDLKEENDLLKFAMHSITPNGRVVIKRALSAPPLANQKPSEVWQNNVVRFDAYF